MAEIEVKVNLPGPDTPGFLRRQRDLLAAMGSVEAARGARDGQALVNAMDGLAEELAQYLESSNGMTPRDVAYELSRNQFFEVLGALAGKAESPPSKK